MGKRDSEEQRKTEKEKGKVRGRKNRPETADTRKRERKKRGESSSDAILLRLFQVDLIYS